MKRWFLILVIGVLPGFAFSQIYEPNGLRMPGDWNDWINTLNMGGNFDLSKVDIGTPRWTATFEFTGESGIQEFKFATNDFDNVWGHQWAPAAFQPNLISDLPHTQDGTVANNTFETTQGFWYTVNWKDNGYADTKAVFMETSSEPVEILSVSEIPEVAVEANESVHITVELNKLKSPEELVYLRYSTDSFQSSDAVLVTGLDASKTGTAEIPGQALNSKVEFYILTTTVDKESWLGEADLITIRFNNNSNNNYHYFYKTSVSPAHDATDISVTPTITWFSISDTSQYHFQIDDQEDFSSPVVDIQDLADTSISITDALQYNTDYYWRFAHQDSLWSDKFHFRTESHITFAKIQFPGQLVVDENTPAAIYGRIYIPEITGVEGENLNVKAWLGINSTDSDPETWNEDSWLTAGYNVDVDGNDDDEYLANIPVNLNPGKYFYAFRFQYKNQDYVYGGSNGIWNGIDNTSGALHILQIPVPVAPLDDEKDVAINPVLEWEADDDLIQSFSLQISQSGDFTNVIVDESGISGNTYSPEEALNENTLYFWRVKADYDTTSSAWSDIYTFRTLLQLPEKVVLTAPVHQAANISVLPVFQWEESGNAESYQLQISLDEDFSKPENIVLEISDIIENSYEMGEEDQLDFGHSYHWRLRAYNEAGFGSWSDIREFTTETLTPDLIAPAQNAENQPDSLTFEWSSAADVVVYDFQLSTDAAFETLIADSSGITETKLTISNLSYSKGYYWRVRADYPSLKGNWSEVFTFKVMDDIPSRPNSTVPDSAAYDVSLKPTFSWEAVEYADSYQLQLSFTHHFDSLIIDKLNITETTYKLVENELHPGSIYYWRIRAENESGFGDWSDSLSFLTVAPPPILTSPAHKAADQLTDLQLVWENVPHADNYELWVAEDSAFNEVLIDTTLLQNSFELSNLSFEQQYFWKVSVRYSAKSSDWSQVFSFTIKKSAPLIPELFFPEHEAENVELNTLLKWNESADADYYHIQFAEDAAFESLIMDTSNIQLNQITAPLLNKNTTYFWRVMAVNEGGESDWSQPFSFSTKPDVPDNVILLLPASEQTAVPVITSLFWQKSAGATGYRMQLSKEADFSFKLDSLLSDTTVVIDGLEVGTKYYWRVAALNGGGSSSWSDAFNFTTGVGESAAPGLLTPEDGTANLAESILFSWQENLFAAQYRIQLSLHDTFNSTLIDSLLDNNEIELGGFEKETTYYWRVKALDEGGESQWSEVFSFGTQMELPAVPRLVSPADEESAVSAPLLMNWNIAERAQYYELSLSNQADFSVSLDTVLTDTTFTALSLLSNTTYYWKVRAGNSGGKSNWSDTRFFITLIAAPETPEPVHPGNGDEIIGNVRLAWNHAERAESYTVHLSDSLSFTKLLAEVDGIEDDFIDVPLPEASKTYYWRVMAVNNGGESEWSDTLSFTTKMLTSNEEEMLPTEFALHQNYPNPFNPSTTIRYDLKTAGTVQIQIFDISGRLVNTLVEEYKTAGKHSVTFNAAGLSSGLYFMQMRTKGFTSTKGMVLLK